MNQLFEYPVEKFAYGISMLYEKNENYLQISMFN